MILHYHKLGNLLHEYENMNTFHTRKKPERDYTSHKDMLEEFNDNPRHQERSQNSKIFFLGMRFMSEESFMVW